MQGVNKYQICSRGGVHEKTSSHEIYFPAFSLPRIWAEFNYERELKSYALTGTETELSCGNK